MTTATAPLSVRPTSVIAPLARIEAKRYARHPLFLAGFALALVTSAGEFGPIELDHQVVPAFFLGVLGLVVAARLTTSTRTSGPVVESAPVSETARTAALCLACLVPAAAGLVVVLFHQAFVAANPFPDYIYGTYGTFDRLAITVLIPVIACAGGPLLGVAVGRWWTFPGATLLATLGLLLWSAVCAYVPEQNMDSSSLVARLLHMLTPYTAFGSGNSNSSARPTVITSYTGSAGWFMVWTLALCGLAACAALLHGATGPVRRRVRGAACACVVVALSSLVLSVSFGNDALVETSQQGSASASPSGFPHG
jgi:hypothetical protein